MRLNLATYLIGLLLFGLLNTALANFQCGGTEPFWDLEMSAKGFRYHSQDDETILMPAVKPRAARGIKSSYLRIYETTLNKSLKPITIVIKEDPTCNDGMSEQTFTHEIVLIMPDKALLGCCLLRR